MDQYAYSNMVDKKAADEKHYLPECTTRINFELQNDLFISHSVRHYVESACNPKPANV